MPGELCIEEDAHTVRLVDTRNRLACCDGRFPHWVRGGYDGERYSVVFYRSSGVREASVGAYRELSAP